MPATPTKSTKARTTKAPAQKAPARKTTATKATARKAAVKAPTVKTPATKTPATKTPVTQAPAAKAPRPRVSAEAKTSKVAKVRSAAIKSADLSQDVFTSVESGQRTALAAVRTFVDTVDAALPTLGAHPSRRETVIDAALDMADKLVTSQYNFLRSVVRSADRSLRLSDGKGK